MTIPVLTQVIAEPAKPGTGSTNKATTISSDGTSSAAPDAFANILQAEETAAKGVPEAKQKLLASETPEDAELVIRRENGPVASDDKTPELGAAESPDITVADTPRKSITIPDLPKKQQIDVSAGAAKQPVAAQNAASLTDQPVPDQARVVASSGEAKGVLLQDSTMTSPRKSEPNLGQTETQGLGQKLETAPKKVVTALSGDTAKQSAAVASLTERPVDGVPVSQSKGRETQLNTTEEPRPNFTVPKAEPPTTAPPVAKVLKPNPAMTEEHPRAERLDARLLADEQAPIASNKPVDLVSRAQTQPIAAQLVAAAAPAMQNAIKDTKIQPLHSDGEMESLHFDPRGPQASTTTQSTNFTPNIARADAPRAIAMQIGDAARAMTDRPVEVSLNPDELGRVRLSVSASESGVVLNVLAERPETLDLMRRNAEQLARELADLGFASIELGFGKGEGGAADTGQDDDAAQNGHSPTARNEADITEPDTPPVASIALDGSGGLDIRI